MSVARPIFLRGVIALGMAASLAACGSPSEGQGGNIQSTPTRVSGGLFTPTIIPPTETPTVVVKPEIKLTKEEAVVKVDGIINLIKNPDPELLKKYNVTPKQLADEQAILLYGGTGKGSSDLPKTADGHQYTPDSLANIKALIGKEEYATSKTLIKKFYQTVSNASFNDITQIADRKTARQIDPENLFHGLVMIRPGETIPDDQPLPSGVSPSLGGIHASEVKGDATMGLIDLYYGLPAGQK